MKVYYCVKCDLLVDECEHQIYKCVECKKTLKSKADCTLHTGETQHSKYSVSTPIAIGRK